MTRRPLSIVWALGLVAIQIAHASEPIRRFQVRPTGRTHLSAAAALDAKRSPNTILVRFKPGLQTAIAQDTVLVRHHLQMKKFIPGPDIAVIHVPEGKTPEQVIETLKATEGDRIEKIDLDARVYAHATPNDPLYSTQYHLPISGFPTAWDTTSGSGIKIAIADTGIKSNHVDLATNIVGPGYSFGDDNSTVTDLQGHGTAVAGVAAAVGNNSIGVTGGAFQASILPIKITPGGLFTANSSDVIAAITYAANQGAKVVNVSFGSSVFCAASLWTDAAAYMRSRGGLVTVSAGNDSHNLNCTNDPEIIVVSATTSSDAISPFSNFGPDIDIAAPGSGIVTTICHECTDLGGADYGAVDGTSFSAPLTAGALALIFAIDTTFTPAQAEQILFDSADDLGTAGYDIYYGHGRLNVGRAVAVAAERSVTFRRENLSNVYAYPNPWDVRRGHAEQITFSNLPDSATVKIFTLSGMWIRTVHASNGRAVWNLQNDSGQKAASGLYFYLITASGDNKVRGKIALIR